MSVATTSWTASKSGKVKRIIQTAIILQSLRAQQYWSSRADDDEHRLLFLRSYTVLSPFFYRIHCILIHSNEPLAKFIYFLFNAKRQLFLAIQTIRASTVHIFKTGGD